MLGYVRERIQIWYENAEMEREEKVRVRAIVAYPQSRASRLSRDWPMNFILMAFTTILYIN